jgi:hypothetical protein
VVAVSDIALADAQDDAIVAVIIQIEQVDRRSASRSSSNNL